MSFAYGLSPRCLQTVLYNLCGLNAGRRCSASLLKSKMTLCGLEIYVGQADPHSSPGYRKVRVTGELDSFRECLSIYSGRVVLTRIINCSCSQTNGSGIRRPRAWVDVRRSWMASSHSERRGSVPGASPNIPSLPFAFPAQAPLSQYV